VQPPCQRKSEEKRAFSAERGARNTKLPGKNFRLGDFGRLI
jgi:hypothetical protein